MQALEHPHDDIILSAAVDDILQSKYVYESVIPFVSRYFEIHFPRERAGAVHRRIVADMLDAFMELFTSQTGDDSEGKRAIIAKAVLALQAANANGGVSTPRAEDDVNSSNIKDQMRTVLLRKPVAAPAAAAKHISKEESVLGGLKIFSKYFHESFAVDKELVGLAEIFTKELDTFTPKLINLLG